MSKEVIEILTTVAANLQAQHHLLASIVAASPDSKAILSDFRRRANERGDSLIFQPVDDMVIGEYAEASNRLASLLEKAIQMK